MQKMNTFRAGQMHSLGGGYLPSQWIVLGSGKPLDVFRFLLHEVVVSISLQAGLLFRGFIEVHNMHT